MSPTIRCDDEKSRADDKGQDANASQEISATEEGCLERSGPAAMSMEERRNIEKRLLHTLDVRFLPTVILLYIANFFNRNVISTARLKGLEHDLGLSDSQYDTSVAALFILYIPTQIIFNTALNRVPRPSIYIGSCAIAWGTICAMIGITHNFTGILMCRLLIGLPDAAFFPASFYLLSKWYTRKELAFRTSIMLAGVMCSNAFGSLIAAAILSSMEDKLGIRGWRWCFIIEGVLSVTIGILSLWSLPDLPNNTRWLSHTERQFTQARLAGDTGEADEDVKGDSMWTGLKMAITDVKVLVFSVLLLCDYLGLAFTNFFPTLTKTLGFSDTITLLLAVPPWIVAATVSCFNGLHADRVGERFFHSCNTMWGSIIGFIIALSTLSIGGRYFALFLLATGHGSLPVILAWVSNTVPRPPVKRAAALGIVGGVGNAGNLIGSFAWKASWGPKYHQSMLISLSALVASSILAFVMRCMLERMNKKLDESEVDSLEDVNRERVEDAARLEGITMEEAMVKRKGFSAERRTKPHRVVGYGVTADIAASHNNVAITN